MKSLLNHKISNKKINNQNKTPNKKDFHFAYLHGMLGNPCIACKYEICKFADFIITPRV